MTPRPTSLSYCRGIGTPKTSTIASSKPISKCVYCHSLKIRKAKVDEVEQPPAWWKAPEAKVDIREMVQFPIKKQTRYNPVAYLNMIGQGDGNL